MITFFPVVMTHENLRDQVFNQEAPKGYHYDRFKSGDEMLWSRLQATTDSFSDEMEALTYFQQAFGQSKDDLQKRCFFLKTNRQQIIGSAMAWFGDGRFDDNYGRLHWVVIQPDLRGKGLGKQMINFAMHQLSLRYAKAYLTSQTTSFQAIHYYLDIGFRPLISQSDDVDAWRLLKEHLKHPALG